MTRKAVIQVKCDLCNNQSVDGDLHIVNVVITVEGEKPVEADICDDCAEGSHGTLGEILRYARPVIIQKMHKAPKKAPTNPLPKTGALNAIPNYVTPEPERNVPCDFPGCTFMGMSLQSVGTHKARTHKKAKKS